MEDNSHMWGSPPIPPIPPPSPGEQWWREETQPAPRSPRHAGGPLGDAMGRTEAWSGGPYPRFRWRHMPWTVLIGSLISLGQVAAAVVAGVVVGLGHAGQAPGPAAPAGQVARRCAYVSIATVNTTGHETDLPVTVCGGLSPGGWVCRVSLPGPLAPGSTLDCRRQAR
jgi:hypothetical protein